MNYDNRMKVNLLKVVFLFVSLLVMIFQSILSNAQSTAKRDYKGLDVNFGIRSFLLHSNIQKISQSNEIQGVAAYLKNKKRISTVVLTSIIDPNERQYAASLGVKHYLMKPLAHEAFNSVVDSFNKMDVKVPEILSHSTANLSTKL